MTEAPPIEKLNPSDVLNGASPLVLTVKLRPIAGQDRFQPAGFPEIGHVIYKAPRGNGKTENVCIVDSAASMANHLESVCMRGAHDYDLVEELEGMPYLRCVTGEVKDGRIRDREVIVTSLTEGHRIASTYFLGARNKKTGRWDGKGGQRVGADGRIAQNSFGDDLAQKFGIKPSAESKKAHPPASKWWSVFTTLFNYDPNALVHGVLFPQWQIKISRALTAHLEAAGAARVDRSGVKFDRLGKTTSGQPIFAVDDATAREITVTFILDVALIRSFGRSDGENQLGLNDSQKEFLTALALWKIRRLIEAPFRFRSGCHLEPESSVEIDVNIRDSIKSAEFRREDDANPITDIYWRAEELYREAEADEEAGADAGGSGESEDQTEDETE